MLGDDAKLGVDVFCEGWYSNFPPGYVLSVMDIYVRDSPGSSTLKHLTDLMDMHRANHRTPL